MITSKAKAHEILQHHWQAKRARNGRLSIRGLAKRLSLSAPYLSKVLSGKKPLPMNRVKDLAKELEMDALSVRRLERAILRERKVGEETIDNLALDLGSRSPLASRLPSEDFSVVASQSALAEWYYLPILELVTCQGFQPEWISERLGLKTEVADRAWARLIELGWVTKEGAVWRKAQSKIRFPAHQLDPVIQKHHTKMLAKAGDELNRKRTVEDFRRRLILGATVATNEKSFLKAKAFLEEALFQAANVLTEGPADRVYYLAMQLFPLSGRNQEDQASR